ncbi:DNA adenine methylase [Corynebacterium accolens]|uniref:DNA adenine methylase n=1 Tax=Corynebacterium accolens TaxID=38284 RepID=UPI00254319CD|nr:DNA adenine methylase [Corynebacterium accolens]MDK4267528.1 DNA adenine methylase [Corynebacterium accolens]MDK4269519.1 DNA adenine methylase [Corynebacterium accolens]MDK4308991.1 DNA adenine methylase [Corynebacterium accolens]
MNNVKPLVKWAGGKRQLLPHIHAALPDGTPRRYYEPFIGGGAVLFSLTPACARVNDLNSELINLYEVVREGVDELISLVSTYPNDADFFYQLRAVDRDADRFAALSATERAARTLYLNKTCYNGLYRVNSAGQFNAPFGRYKNPTICDADTLRGVHQYFRDNDITFTQGDFAAAVAGAGEGDFVYFDPPYDPVNVTSSFTGYQKGGFDRAEQERLKAVCDDLDARGVKFLLSNSATEFIRELYADFSIDTVAATRAINSVGSRRGKVDEVLVRNYEVGHE